MKHPQQCGELPEASLRRRTTRKRLVLARRWAAQLDRREAAGEPLTKTEVSVGCLLWLDEYSLLPNYPE